MKDQNIRIESYYSILKSIYGKDYTEFLTTKDLENNLFIMNDYSKVIWKLINKERNVDQACKNCEKYFSALKYSTIYHHRIMDFPCWDPQFPLDFNKDHVKSIFVLGIDPGPKIRTDTHIAYELGMYPVLEDGTYDVTHVAQEIRQNEEKYDSFNDNIKRTKSCKFWSYFNKLFSENLEFVMKNIYITDICKCFESNRANKKKVMNECINRYLMEEIRLISPKLIIGQGNKPFEEITKLFDLKTTYEIKIPDRLKISQNFPKLFKIYHETLKQEIYFAKIYHTSRNNDAKWKTYMDKLKEFFQDYIYPIIGFN